MCFLTNTVELFVKLHLFLSLSTLSSQSSYVILQKSKDDPKITSTFIFTPKISIWKRSGHMVLSIIVLFSISMVNQLLEFKDILRSKPSEKRKTDKQTRQLLLYLFTSTRGGFTRLRIVMCLLDHPYNTHQLSQELELDYKAVQHHMKVLEKNNMVSKIGEKYGSIFHLSTFLEINIHTLEEAIDKLDRKLNHKKIYL